MVEETVYVDYDYNDYIVKNVPVEILSDGERVIHGKTSLILSVIYEYRRDNNHPFKEIEFEEAKRHKGIISLWNSYMDKHERHEYKAEDEIK